MRIEEQERKFLACIMAQPEECRMAVEMVEPTDFIIEEHQKAYGAFKPVFARGGGYVTIPLLEISLDLTDLPAQIKDSMLMDFAVLAYSAAGVEELAKNIVEASKLRNIEETAKTVLMEIQNGVDSQAAVKILSEAISKTDMRTGQKIRSSIEIAKEFVGHTQKIIETGVSGIKIGVKWLDDLWAGLEPGDTHIIAGRPGTGKSMLLTQMELELSKNLNVLTFSLEMGERQNVSRELSNITGINSAFLRDASFHKRDYEKLTHGILEYTKRKLFKTSSMSQTINSIVSLSHRAKRENKIDIVIIDYLTLIQSEVRGENRTVQIGAISRRLKTLAAELNIPIIIAAQLSRDSEKEKRRPMLSDLRECGDIEQDASKVLFLHREGENTRLIKSKDRHFYTGEQMTRLDGATNTFYPIEEQNDNDGWGSK